MKTPGQIDNRVKGLLNKLLIIEEPFYVKVIPDNDSLPDNCFENVENKVAREKGERILGWQIWEFPYTIEAEFHAIWRSQNGEFTDITPKTVPTDRILFIEDTKMQYQGKQVDNVRMNITGNRLVDDLIELRKAIFRIQNEGQRAYQKGMITLTGNDYDRWETVMLLISILTKMIEEGLSRNSFCPCSSNLKYKQCHGKILPALLAKIS